MLDVANSNADEGAEIIAFNYHGGPNQHWTVQHVYVYSFFHLEWGTGSSNGTLLPSPSCGGLVVKASASQLGDRRSESRTDKAIKILVSHQLGEK